MTIFDLLFIAVFLSVVAGLVVAAAFLLRRRWRAAGWSAAATGVVACAYLGVVLVVSLTSPPRVYRLGQMHCADDWCFGVSGVEFASQLGGMPAQGTAYVVHLRIYSRAIARPQRERGNRVYLLGPRGRLIRPSQPALHAWEASHGHSIDLDAQLAPGESAEVTRVFDVPRGARLRGLVLMRPFGPGLFVIGDDGSLEHQLSYWALPAPK